MHNFDVEFNGLVTVSKLVSDNLVNLNRVFYYICIRIGFGCSCLQLFTVFVKRYLCYKRNLLFIDRFFYLHLIS